MNCRAQSGYKYENGEIKRQMRCSLLRRFNLVNDYKALQVITAFCYGVYNRYQHCYVKLKLEKGKKENEINKSVL